MVVAGGSAVSPAMQQPIPNVFSPVGLLSLCQCAADTHRPPQGFHCPTRPRRHRCPKHWRRVGLWNFCHVAIDAHLSDAEVPLSHSTTSPIPMRFTGGITEPLPQRARYPATPRRGSAISLHVQSDIHPRRGWDCRAPATTDPIPKSLAQGFRYPTPKHDRYPVGSRVGLRSFYHPTGDTQSTSVEVP